MTSRYQHWIMPALQCFVIFWICVGLTFKVMTTPVFSLSSIGILTLDLTALVIAIWRFGYPWARLTLLALFLIFCAIHEFVLWGLIKDCNCFGQSVHVNSWIMLAVNAACALGLAVAPRTSKSTHWLYKVASIVAAIIVCVFVVHFRSPFLFPVQPSVIAITEGSRLTDYPNTDALAFLTDFQVSDPKSLKAFFYDPACQSCAAAKKMVVKIVEDDLYTENNRWIFINIGSVKSNSVDLERLGKCVWIPDRRIAVPLVLSVSSHGIIVDLHYF